MSICDCHFYGFHVVLGLWVKDNEFVFVLFLHFSDPSVTLKLGINQKWEHSSFSHKDTILFGKLIIWQPFQTPLNKLNWLDQELWEVVVF